MKKFLIIIGILLIIAITIAYLAIQHNKPTAKPPQTAKYVDLQKYSGKWYQVAYAPHPFERNCECAQIRYNLEGKYIKIINSCYRDKGGRLDVVIGKAWPIDSSNSKLKVQYFWPFHVNYWIIYVDKDYKYAVIAKPSRKYILFLSRTEQIPDKVLAKLMSIAKREGFETGEIVKSARNCRWQYATNPNS